MGVKRKNSPNVSDNQKSGDSMKIYFPENFSIINNIDFMDHIADAETISFDR